MLPTATTSPRSTCEGASSPPSPPRSRPPLSCRRSPSPLPSSGACAGSKRSRRFPSPPSLRLPSPPPRSFLHGLHRARPLRALARALRAPRLHHQDRQRPPAPRARRGRLELPAPSGHRDQPAAAEPGSASPRSSPTHGRPSAVSTPGSTPSPERRTATWPWVAVARELSGFVWGLMTDHIEDA